MPVKIYDTDQLTPEQKEAYDVLFASTTSPDGVGFCDDASGLMNTQPLEPTFGFIKAPVETVVNGQVEGNAQIVFGRDRPGSIMGPGYGSEGAMHADSIDIVVGRGSSLNDGAGPNQGDFVNPNFASDAARIHISQRTDIDKNFGLDSPESLTWGARRPISTGKSGIGIKADGVRVIGREGVKIVSGPSYAFGPTETNSRGESIEGTNPKIELIAGNFVGEPNTPGQTLQGVAKGKNLEACLLTLLRHINTVIDRLIQHAMLQNALTTAMAANVWHPHYAGIGSFTVSQVSDTIITPLQALRNELTTHFPEEYLEDGSDNYITSTKVLTT